MSLLRSFFLCAALILSMQQSAVAEGGWAEDTNSSCKIWNPAPQPNETVSWSGDCKNGFADGYGEEAWFEDGQPGNVIKGTAVKGRMKGKVQVRYQTGHEYIGRLDASGNRTGVGKFVAPDGSYYVGNFLSGAFHGRGKITNSDGREIVANWKNGQVVLLISDNLPKPFEKECVEYGFKKGTSAFSDCRMKLAEAQQQLAMMNRQYELQREMYQQQVAAYNAQQEAIRKESERRRSEALLRLGLGMMNSQSPTFAGGLSDGVAAMYGLPPKPPAAPPPPPNIGNYTVRLPNGNQVYCNYVNNYMSCR